MTSSSAAIASGQDTIQVMGRILIRDHANEILDVIGRIIENGFTEILIKLTTTESMTTEDIICLRTICPRVVQESYLSDMRLLAQARLTNQRLDHDDPHTYIPLIDTSPF